MRRKLGLFFVGGLLSSLVLTASAFGQGSVLQVNVKEPVRGQAITVTGTNFSSAAGRSPVNIRLNLRSGRVLATPTPDSAGRISATFPVPPDLAPGWYLLIGTQTVTANGRQLSFTPGRTRIRVRASAAGAAAPGGRGGLPGSPPALVILGSAVVLLTAGATLTVRRLRTSNRLQLGS